MDLGQALMLFSKSKTKRRTSAYVHTPWTDLGAKIRGEQSEDAGRLSLDFERLARMGFITPSTIDLDLARDFSMVKRRLFRRLGFFGAEEAESGSKSVRRCPIVLITSGNPGEGKTFSSINFALSLAIEEQLNVLLIDSDLANPSVPRVIGFPYRKHGLFECLIDPKASLDEVIMRMAQIPLSIMPAGEATKSPSSLLGGKPMKDILRRVMALKRYDIIVMDGPPLLATTEAAVLAPHADEVVLVIGAGEATGTQLDASLDLLDVSAEKVSLLLNRAVISERHAAFYGYDQAGESLPA
ncbi:MAG: CpsD/CapB family tyrosine-protein kinase [Alphaproteobacteria bacterium]